MAMKAPLPSEIWPLYPVSRFRPIRAIAKIPTVANSKVVKVSVISGIPISTTMPTPIASRIGIEKPKSLVLIPASLRRGRSSRPAG